MVTGKVAMSVSDPATFVEDPEMQAAAKASIAEMAGVQESFIDVTLEVVSRRLGGSPRRLSNGTVQVSYTITIPADAEDGAEAIAGRAETAISSAEAGAVTAVFQHKIAGSAHDYTVEVIEVSQPVEVSQSVVVGPSASDLSGVAERGPVSLLIAGLGLAGAASLARG